MSTAYSSRKAAAQSRTSRVLEPVRSAGSSAVSAVREHPIPALMIGGGLALLLLENRGFQRVESRLMEKGQEVFDEVTETLSGAAETARDAMSNMAGTVGRGLGTAAESVAEGTSTIGRYARNGASTVGSTIGGAASSVAEGAEASYEGFVEAIADFWRRHPLVACASVLAAGVGAGMLLPSNRRDNGTTDEREQQTTRRKQSSKRSSDRRSRATSRA